MEYQYQGYKLDRPHICTSLGDEETLQSIEGLAYAYALTKTITVSGMLNINKDNSKQIPMEKLSMNYRMNTKKTRARRILFRPGLLNK